MITQVQSFTILFADDFIHELDRLRAKTSTETILTCRAAMEVPLPPLTSKSVFLRSAPITLTFRLQRYEPIEGVRPKRGKRHEGGVKGWRWGRTGRGSECALNLGMGVSVKTNAAGICPYPQVGRDKGGEEERETPQGSVGNQGGGMGHDQAFGDPGASVTE